MVKTNNVCQAVVIGNENIGLFFLNVITANDFDLPKGIHFSNVNSPIGNCFGHDVLLGIKRVQNEQDKEKKNSI